MINDEAHRYYVTGTDEYTKYLVENLKRINPTSLQGRNISMDIYFTSVTIASQCLEKEISIVGTMQLDRKGIPKEIKDVSEREERSTLYFHAEKENIMVVLYFDKKKSGKKNVIVLTTMHNCVKITQDPRQKLQVHTFYDHTKGGIDIVDLSFKPFLHEGKESVMANERIRVHLRHG